MSLRKLLDSSTFQSTPDKEKLELLSEFYDKNTKKISMNKKDFIDHSLTYSDISEKYKQAVEDSPESKRMYHFYEQDEKQEWESKVYQPLKIIKDDESLAGEEPEFKHADLVSDEEMNPFFKGMTNSIASRTMGNVPQELSNPNPSFADEALFTLGKALVDVPVIAGVGAATAAVGAPAAVVGAASFAAYEAFDRITDIISRQEHGLADYDEMQMNPYLEGLKVAPVGAAKGLLGYGGGALVRGGTSLGAKVLAKNALEKSVSQAGSLTNKAILNAARTVKAGNVAGFVAGEAAANEIVGRMSAAQHGTEFGMRERALDLITTSAIMGSARGGARAGDKALKIIKGNKGNIAAVADDISVLDPYVRSLADAEIKSTATDAAKKYFVRGGTPEETAQLTLKKIQELSSSENFGHPFRNEEDKVNYEKKVYEAAKKIDLDNTDVLDINTKGTQIADGTPIEHLGAKAESKSLETLMELRGRERTLLQEKVDKINKVSVKELDSIQEQIDAVRKEQSEIYNTVHKKSKSEIYGLMKKEARMLDTERNYIENANILNSLYELENLKYAEQGVHRVLNLTKEEVVNAAARTRPPKLGRIGKWYSDTLKTSTRIADQVMGETNAALFKQALRGADAKRTQTLVRMYKHLEMAGKDLSSTEIRAAVVSMIRKQMSRKGVTFEDGTKGSELKNVGEKIIQDMFNDGLITADELASSNNLNLSQEAFIKTVRSLMDETIDVTNKSRKVMGLEEVEPLPDYYPLMNDVESMPYNRVAKDAGIGWQEDSPVRESKKINETPSNLKHRSARDFDRVVNLDGMQTVQSYLRYMINKAYMNPVATKYYDFGKAMNELHGNGAGNPLMSHAKFISGDIQPVISKVVDNILNKVTTKVSSSMLLYNYSTWMTQLSSLDGIIAECGFKGVAGALGDLGLDSQNWKDVRQQSASLIAREGSGDITIVNIQESLTGKMMGKIIDKGMYPTMALDMVSATIGQKAFYNKAKRMGMSDFDARAYADEWVVRTQASSSRIDVSPVLRNALGKNIFALQTFSLNRFDYIVSDLFGAQPIYKFMEKVDDEDVAKSMAQKKGWVYDSMPDGNGFCIYDINKANTFIEATKKTARLIVAQQLFNMAYDVVEDFTGAPFAKPNPDVVGAFIEEKYGVSITGKVRGKLEKNSNLSESERDRRALVASLQEFLEIVPVVSSMAKYSTSISGPTISKMMGASQKAQYFLKSGNIKTGLQALNDFSTLFGNPFHAPTAKFLHGLKNYEEGKERSLRASKEYQKQLKQIISGRKPAQKDALKILMEEHEKEKNKP